MPDRRMIERKYLDVVTEAPPSFGFKMILKLQVIYTVILVLSQDSPTSTITKPSHISNRRPQVSTTSSTLWENIRYLSQYRNSEDVVLERDTTRTESLRQPSEQDLVFIDLPTIELIMVSQPFGYDTVQYGAR
ncbi:uncharacterized protein RSE6_09184 [Rhynchosporium secalis]|uniref:Uncharacterized protein n=1 Tax=Rhynchosporium secalis TaxID=38038 RepID=A0A1E1MIF1_RHYSE|nr:uncharacterized protein RSE6_09184 [Rhynchosporium secalis]